MLEPMTTARLTLRKPRLSDARDFFDMLSDAQTCRMDGGYPPYATMDDAMRDLREILDTSDDRLFIEETASGRMIGLLHVMPGETPACAEIGYVIHRDVRRRGYATEAVRALLNQLREGGMQRVRATCYVSNDASAAMLLKLGFTETEPIANEKNLAFSQRCFVLSLGNSHRKRLYLIGGPMGVGKTAVCQRLNARLERSVFLDGDWCWMMHPFAVTDETKAMVMDNIAHLLTNFLRCSALDHVVFCWVMHEQAIIDDLLARLPLDGVTVVPVSLVCSSFALTRRIMGDIKAGLRTPDVLPRSLDRLPLYDALNTIKIDTSFLTPDEAAHEILARCERITINEE